MIKHHGWDNYFKWPLYSLPSELTNSMVSFQVSIGSLNMKIFEGIRKQLLNSALYDLKNYTDLSIFSVIQYLLLFLICQLTFLTNFQLHPLAFLISCGLKFKNIFSMSSNNKGFNFTSLRRMRFMNRGVKSSNLKQTTKELNFIVTKTKLQLLLQIETIITNYSKRLPLLSVISLGPRNCFKTCVKEKYGFSPRHRESAMLLV